MRAWLELASYLQKPLQRVQAETTASEFLIWLEYLKDDLQRKTRRTEKMDFYLAQIAAEVRRSYVKNPRSIKITDFLLKFDEQDKPKKMTREERTKIAKRFWGQSLRIKLE